MKLEKGLSIALTLALVVLFGLAIWFRISSLKAAPQPFEDEAYFGVQTAHLLAGETVATKTPTGNPLNYLLVVLEAPLVAAFGPSFTVLRITAVFAGLAAILLMYVLMARVLDRTTALIAAALLAALPIAIIHSRLAWEASQFPLFSILSLYFAFRGRRLALLLSYIFSLYLHPTFVFQAPILLCILAVPLLRQTAGDPPARLRALMTTMGVALLVVVPYGLLKKQSRGMKYVETFHSGLGPCDWGKFFKLFQNLLLGRCQGVPTDTSHLLDWTFWSILVGALVFGSYRLIRQRAWDRLALVVGVVIGVTGFHLTLGPDVLHPAMSRYGMFLVAPVVLAFACLVRSLLVPASSRPLQVLRGGQVALLLAIGLALLFSFKIHFFDIFAIQQPGGERIWTLKDEMTWPQQGLTSLILRDLDRAGAVPTQGRRVVIVQGWDSPWCIRFLASRRRDIKVVHFDIIGSKDKDGPVKDLARIAAEQRRVLLKQISEGGYGVGLKGQTLDQWVAASFPPERLRRWEVQLGWSPPYVIYRLKRPAELADSALPQVAGRIEGQPPSEGATEHDPSPLIAEVER
ncbi:MAG: hypothetical protein IRY99_04345 [Isosphaeraceae bacterium]|nr:hypothetical protein [Isosphaeraceae bacterium]